MCGIIKSSLAAHGLAVCKTGISLHQFGAWRIPTKFTAAVKAFLVTVFITSVCGAFAGAIYGAIYAFPFSIVGIVVGLGLGARGGFVAGIIGYFLRGRAGWALGGIIGGLAAWGAFNPTLRFHNVWECLVFFLPSIFGGIFGLVIGFDERKSKPFLPVLSFAKARAVSVQWQSPILKKLRYVLIALFLAFFIASVRNGIQSAHWDKFDERNMLIDLYSALLNNPNQGYGSGFRVSKDRRTMIYNRRTKTLTDTATKSTWDNVTDTTLQEVAGIDGGLEDLSRFGATKHKSGTE